MVEPTPGTHHSGREEEEQLVRQAVARAAGPGHEGLAEIGEPAGLAAVCPVGEVVPSCSKHPE